MVAYMLFCNYKFFVQVMAYLVWDRGKDERKGIAKAFSNRTTLSEFTGISYHTLTHHFVRKGEVWHYYEGPGIYVIYFEGMERGRQRFLLDKKEKPGHNRNI
jgi:hypothetical protein